MNELSRKLLHKTTRNKKNIHAQAMARGCYRNLSRSWSLQALSLVLLSSPFLQAEGFTSVIKTTSLAYSRWTLRPDLVVAAANNNVDNRSVGDANSYNTLSIQDDLVRCLDLIPLIQGISKHAATYRGRQAFLSLIGQADFQQRQKANNDNNLFMTSKRKRVMGLSTRITNNNNVHNNNDIARDELLIPVATSASEARAEYEFIEQAMLALQKTNEFSIPPLYGANSSPWDTDTLADTDDDEWLFLPAEMWTLENILQADKVVEKLLMLSYWAQEDDSQLWMPGLSQLGRKISQASLERLSGEIKGAVEIVRHRSLVDPRGNRSFTFRLNAKKFPSLQSLYEKELRLAESIDREIAIALRKQKGSNESLEFQGRKVLSLPKGSTSSKLGVVRGKSESGGRSYIEPHQTVELGDQLSRVRHELEVLQQEIQLTLIQSIQRASVIIDEGLQIMARLDVIVARAAFGSTLKGAIPKVGNDGRIEVKSFLHPVLALREQEKANTLASVVPIDLHLSDAQGDRALIISGPNGGGKTLALKSFGLACILCKLGVPFPSSSRDSKPRVDFFTEVLVQIGDAQSVTEGESTLMARLNAMSSVIQQVSSMTESGKTQYGSSLILLDELGSGTDPTAGSAIAQSVLEKILEYEPCRIVATTHSPQLKALSLENEQFNCATVLLEKDTSDSEGISMPTFELKYGVVGDSYALGAAFRCIPRLPEDVLSRASSLMSAENSDEANQRLRAMTLSLEQQTEAVKLERMELERLKEEAKEIKNAMVSLAESYESRLNTLEQRLNHCFEGLRADDTKDSVELVGESLGELRLMKKKTKTEADLLREKGLKMVPDSYSFTDGESVVILAKGEFEGETGKVTLSAPGIEGQVTPDEVVIIPSWSPSTSWDDESFLDPMAVRPLILKRFEVAIWDFDSVWDDGSEKQQPPRTKSIRESQKVLFDKLSSVKKESPTITTTATKVSKTNNKFTSSRQRKASKKKKKK